MNNYLDVGISIGRTRRRKPMNTTSKREEHRSQERKEPSAERKEETSDVYKKRENRRTKGKIHMTERKENVHRNDMDITNACKVKRRDGVHHLTS